jgi:hypothetical protein
MDPKLAIGFMTSRHIDLNERHWPGAVDGPIIRILVPATASPEGP